MQYEKTIQLKDGTCCVLRGAQAADGQALLELFILTHGETDFLASYPDEVRLDAAAEADFLAKKAASANEIEILAVVDGEIAGTAGISAVGSGFKRRRRAVFGVSVARAYWGRGIGRALTEACIACARKAGYAQLELEAVADNRAATALYEKVGFREYGRNPRGFFSRSAGWQTLVLMRLELD